MQMSADVVGDGDDDDGEAGEEKVSEGISHFQTDFFDLTKQSHIQITTV